MNDAFTVALEGWHDFYLMVGPTAATLIGLLFVALSLNPAILQRAEHRAVRALARRSFASFLYVLVVAGVLLVPRLSAPSAAVTLICIAAFGLFHAARDLRALAGGDLAGRGELVRRSGLLVAALGGLFAVGILLGQGRFAALYGLPWVLLALLAAASQNAWVLLFVARAGEV